MTNITVLYVEEFLRRRSLNSQAKRGEKKGTLLVKPLTLTHIRYSTLENEAWLSLVTIPRGNGFPEYPTALPPGLYFGIAKFSLGDSVHELVRRCDVLFKTKSLHKSVADSWRAMKNSRSSLHAKNHMRPRGNREKRGPPVSEASRKLSNTGT